jgi:hypothetical protein
VCVALEITSAVVKQALRVDSVATPSPSWLNACGASGQVLAAVHVLPCVGIPALCASNGQHD